VTVADLADRPLPMTMPDQNRKRGVTVPKRQRIGLIVNPVAGMGGSVGLKGTDGDLASKARALGAEPQAAHRAGLALQQLYAARGSFDLLTCGGDMGETVAREAGFDAAVIHVRGSGESTAEDTRAAVRSMLDRGVDLLLFAGGDGTAREVHRVAGDAVAVLGIPAGVKMHSAVFAVTAKTAGDLVLRYLRAAEPGGMLALAEVMDRETGVDGTLEASPVLYGFMRVPRHAFLVQAAKASSAISEDAALEGACQRAAALARETSLAIIGPGSTMQRIKALLGVAGSLLGVDAFADGVCVGRDLSESGLLELLRGQPARIFLTVIGGQGFLLGRGNQQISAEVVRRVGRDNIVVVASIEKLTALPGGTLRVDTGCDATDRLLSGHLQVFSGTRRSVICPVSNLNADAR